MFTVFPYDCDAWPLNWIACIHSQTFHFLKGCSAALIHVRNRINSASVVLSLIYSPLHVFSNSCPSSWRRNKTPKLKISKMIFKFQHYQCHITHSWCDNQDHTVLGESSSNWRRGHFLTQITLLCRDQLALPDGRRAAIRWCPSEISKKARAKEHREMDCNKDK